MWSVSTTSVVPSQCPRENPNCVCSAGATAFGDMWITRRASYSSIASKMSSPCFESSIGSGEIMISGVPLCPHFSSSLSRGFHSASFALPAALSG